MMASEFGVQRFGTYEVQGGRHMLVLTRKTGERIVIGDGVELTVLLIRGQRVRLGISAPSNVPVNRAELTETTGKKQSSATISK